MYCKNCNQTYETGEQFCIHCGAALENSISIGETLVRRHTTSKLFLTATILFSLSVLSNFLWFVLRLIYNLFHTGFHSAALEMSLTSLITSPLMLLCNIAVVTGLWMHFCACRKPAPTKTAGLTLLKIMQILTAILLPLATLTVGVLTSIAIVMRAMLSADLTILLLAAAAVVTLLLPFFVFAEIYWIKNILAINKIKKMLGGEALQKMPLYNIIYIFITSVLSIVSLLFFATTLPNALIAIALQLAMLLYAVVFIRFNADVKTANATVASPASPAQSPSEAAASLLMQDAEDILQAQTDNDDTIEDMPQA